MSFNETLQNLVNKDYDELLGFAKIAIGKIYPACQEVDKDNKGVFMLTSIILSAIAADGKLTAIEKKFLKDLLEITDEQVDFYITAYDSQMAELTEKFANTLSAELKANVVMLVCAVAACDETISREETAFIQKLLD